MHMGDDHLSKIICDQLRQGVLSYGEQSRQFKGVLKASLKTCCIGPNELETAAAAAAVYIS